MAANLSHAAFNSCCSVFIPSTPDSVPSTGSAVKRYTPGYRRARALWHPAQTRANHYNKRAGNTGNKITDCKHSKFKIPSLLQIFEITKDRNANKPHCCHYIDVHLRSESCKQSPCQIFTKSHNYALLITTFTRARQTCRAGILITLSPLRFKNRLRMLAFFSMSLIQLLHSAGLLRSPRAGPEPDTRIKEGVNIPCTWGNLQRR
jgi:hypothetical protein